MMEKNNLYYDKLRKKEWKDTADYGPSAQSRYKVIINLLKKNTTNKNLRILDCGCGIGNILLRLKREGYNNLYGSDFSKEAIKLSKSKVNLKLFNADLTKLNSFGKRRFDVVICSEVLEHIENDSLAINNLFSLLNKKGILIISVPYQMKYWSQHDDFSGHVRRYEKDEIENKLKKRGFNILESFGWGGLIYPFYHILLTKKSPSLVMGEKNKFAKKIIAKILYFVFFIESLSKSKKRARRIFVVAQRRR